MSARVAFVFAWQSPKKYFLAFCKLFSGLFEPSMLVIATSTIAAVSKEPEKYIISIIRMKTVRRPISWSTYLSSDTK